LLGSSRTRRVLTVQLPSSIPYLIGPLRWVYSFGLGICVVVEYLAADSGIGRAMKEVTAYSRADLIVVGVIWTLVLAFIFDGLLLAMLSAGLEWTDRKALLRWISR